ncbi:MAG: S8 family serine peptidase [Bacteroidota bacterium]|nr:S8 family serine peptidase [Bacteroidota bacterium]
MKKILSFITFITLCNISISQTVYKHQVDGEIYVKFTPGALKSVAKDNPNNLQISKLTNVSNVLFKYGATKAYKPFYQANDDAKLPYILKVEFSQINEVENLIRELKAIPGVEYAEKVSLNTVDITPNDPTFGGHLTQINAANAWNIFNSTSFGTSSITCAIVDNAVAWTHSDLVANTYTNTGEIAGNSIDDDGNGYIDDVNGWDAADNDNNPIPSNTSMNHGSHCAGIAGARTDNGSGIASIGWNIKIIPVKCQTNTGSTTGIANGYGGIIYAAKAKARIISCSWGGASAASSAEQSVIDYAWNKGCIVICAAGNDNNSTLHYPGAYNNVLCVSSVSSSNVKSSFSCFGTWVDIAAPGENIMSTGTTNNYFSSSGTSMATPLVAGLASLMLSKTPYMTQNDVINCIKSTAVNIYTISGNSAYVTGSQLGTGRIDAFAAMNCAASFSNTPVVSNFYSLIKNTCPGTPIVFTDSSLYVPTAWSWTFQAGIPATSTSSAPSVQWAAPGTYSVALQATNSNGGSTKVKLAYITVAGPIALPLSEGFQGATFLPINWTGVNIDNDNIFWTKTNSAGGFGTSGSSALFDDYNLDAAGARDEIRTPKYVFSSVATATLGFDVAYKQYDNQFSDTLEVKLSTNCGTSWTTIYNKGGSTLSTSPGTLQANTFTPSTSAWRTETVNISALTTGQSNVMISFVNRGHYGQALYLDNVNIQTTAIISPTANFNLTSPICSGASITLTNTSTGATTYSWTMPGGAPASSTATNPIVSYATGGTYSITLVAINGTLTSTLTKTISITTTPTVTVNSATICSGNTATLTASGASTYSWNTGSTSNSLTVSPVSLTVYTITGFNGVCTNVKTSTVTVNTTPTVAISNQTICAGGTATLNATGATTYSWSTGSTSNPLLVSPSSNTTYIVTGNSLGCTNTKTVSVTIGSALSILITPSNPAVCGAGSVNITASGASNYTWSTGSNASSVSFIATSTSTYSVIGSNAGCLGTNIFTVTVNPFVTGISNNNSLACFGDTNGSATVTAIGGTPGYTYLWSPGSQTTAIINGLSQGAYFCTITDTKGCSAVIGVGISSPSLLISSASGSNTTCGLCNGSSSITANGGTFPYSYLWSNASASNSINGLCSGVYSYTVTDGNGCKSNNSINIGNSSSVTTSLSFTNASCSSCPDGIAGVTAAGGAGPYTYSWTPSGGTLAIANGLAPACYTVITSDSQNCTSSASVCVGFSTRLNQTSLVNNSLLIYPNPAQTQVIINYVGAEFSYTVYNNLGQLIDSKQNNLNMSVINLNSYSKGIYLIEVTVGKETVHKKLIVE